MDSQIQVQLREEPEKMDEKVNSQGSLTQNLKMEQSEPQIARPLIQTLINSLDQ